MRVPCTYLANYYGLRGRQVDLVHHHFLCGLILRLGFWLLMKLGVAASPRNEYWLVEIDALARLRLLWRNFGAF